MPWPLGRPCHICHHEKRPIIEKALVEGASAIEVSRLYAVDEDAVLRHCRNHMTEQLAKAAAEMEEEERKNSRTLLAEVRSLLEKAKGIMEEALTAGERKTALMGIREACRCLELLAKVEGMIPQQVVNIFQLTAWTSVEAVLVEALAPYPEARAKVIEALAAMPEEGEG